MSALATFAATQAAALLRVAAGRWAELMAALAPGRSP